MKIKLIDAIEILDSRGNPTVKVFLETTNGEKVSADVPSGASTGENEALELRDNDPKRYLGKGVLKPIENIKEKIAPAILGMNVNNQREIDDKMLELDGTESKRNLGANAILGVSLAVLRAAAKENKRELYLQIAELFGTNKNNIQLPDLMCNVINGGIHADSGLDIQEYMLVPKGINSIGEKIRAVAEIYHKLKENLKKENKGVSVGDEGGFAPKLVSNEDPFRYLMSAIEDASYKIGSEIYFAVDAAASEFYSKEKKKYLLGLDNKEYNSEEMVEYWKELAAKYPILIIEDGIAENDLEGWKMITKKLGDEISVMGDDFTVTNKKRLERAVEEKALNSILIKLNQIGTVSETIECMQFARQNKIKTSVSHRSGDTCDSLIADFAVGSGSNWIKSGATARGERLSKYNRLLEIEHYFNQR